MKLILVDPDVRLCRAWEVAFRLPAATGSESSASSMLHPDVEVRHGILQQVTNADALVTAGNSFGLMDGGVDRVVAEMFPGIEGEMQATIREQYFGELLVGESLFISGFARGVIYAPTMRIPMSIARTDAPYRAFWSALRTAHRAGVQVLAVPGLGTGTGRVTPAEAARQMAVAWSNFRRVPERMSWRSARVRHAEIMPSSDR